MKKINVGLIGFGKIGSGVVKVLKGKKKFLKDKSGIDINIDPTKLKTEELLSEARWSGGPDLNWRPLAPQASALAGLSHPPSVQIFCPPTSLSAFL